MIQNLRNRLSSRRRHAAAGALALLSAMALGGCGGGTSSTAVRSPGADVGTQMDVSLPDSVTSLPLVTSDGRTTSLAALRGKIVLLQDTTTLCQESCPLDTAALVGTAAKENAAGHEGDVVYVSATVDPARDDVAQLKAYRALFDAPSNWLAATGTVKNVDTLWTTLGVWREKVATDEKPAPKNWRTGAALTYDVNHSDETFFLDRAGHLRFVLEGVPQVGRGDLPATLQKFLSDEGRQNLATPEPGAWTDAQAQQEVEWLLAQK